MKTFLWPLASLMVLTSLPLHGEPPAKHPAPQRLPGWGTATDPEKDCTFFLAKGALLISVPGTRPHDLAA